MAVGGKQETGDRAGWDHGFMAVVEVVGNHHGFHPVQTISMADERKSTRPQVAGAKEGKCLRLEREERRG